MFEHTKTETNTTLIRPAAVAGMFYPADAEQLGKMIADMLKNGLNKTPLNKQVKALIVPHAGYVYSGQAAADAYACLLKHGKKISKVVLLGPAHRVAFQGIAGTKADYFATPLGKIRIDKGLLQQAYQIDGVIPLDEAHAEEHSLEVQLPFLQTVLDDFSLAPFVVGDTSDEQVAELLDALWGGDETLIVISSDLSHFLDYDSAVQRDLKTVSEINTLQGNKLGPHDACGYKPVRGVLNIARERKLQIEKITYYNSGDSAGDKNRVVGYASFALFEDAYDGE